MAAYPYVNLIYTYYKPLFSERNKLRIISKKKIRDYRKGHAQAELPLTEWYFILRAFNPKNINALRKKFNHVDAVNGYTIFNVGGNHYRLITALHYNTPHGYMRAIGTQAEYSKPYNQAKLKRGE